MSEFLGIDIKTLDNGVSQFCQTGLIRKVLEATWMEDCNGFPTPTKEEAPHGTDVNGSEAKIDWPNSILNLMSKNIHFDTLFDKVIQK